jgi:hypothetical protein
MEMGNLREASPIIALSYRPEAVVGMQKKGIPLIDICHGESRELLGWIVHFRAKKWPVFAVKTKTGQVRMWIRRTVDKNGEVLC